MVDNLSNVYYYNAFDSYMHNFSQQSRWYQDDPQANITRGFQEVMIIEGFVSAKRRIQYIALTACRHTYACGV